METQGSSTSVRLGPNALGVQANRNIHTFADAYVITLEFLHFKVFNFYPSRRSDIVNERLPQFQAPSEAPVMFPTPSMRPHRRGSAEGEELNMEYLIKKTLEEDIDEGGLVERLADRIARGRNAAGRPSPLKRFGTA